jgi:probable O-glycosylation ligase (exosortase A-associated)
MRTIDKTADRQLIRNDSKMDSHQDRKVYENKWAFRALLFFTFMVYVSPQTYLSFLHPFRLALVSAALALFSHFCSKGPKLKFDAETRCVIFIALWSLISVPKSIWPGGSLEFFLGQFSKVIITYVLLANVLKSVSSIKKLMGYMVVFCAFIALQGINNYLSGNFIGYGRIEGTGAILAANSNDLALTLNLIIPLAMGLAEMAQERRQRLLWYSLAVLSVVGVVVSFSRGGFVVLAVIGFIWLRQRAKISGFKIYVLALLLVLCVLPMLPGGYTDRLSTIFNFSEDKTGSANARWRGTKAALDVMADHPITGVGLGMNILAMKGRGLGWIHTHNVYLEIGADIGIPGMIVFIFLLFRLIKNMSIIKKAHLSEHRKPAVAVLAHSVQTSLIGFAVAGFLHPVSYHFYFYYLAGFAVAIKHVEDLTPELNVNAQG